MQAMSSNGSKYNSSLSLEPVSSTCSKYNSAPSLQFVGANGNKCNFSISLRAHAGVHAFVLDLFLILALDLNQM